MNMQSTREDHKERVRAALADQAEALFREFVGEPERAGARSWRSKDNGALSMKMQGSKRGQWYEHKSGEGGDLFDLIAVYRFGLTRAGDDFPRVMAEAERIAGIDPTRPVDHEALAKSRQKRAEKAEADQRKAEKDAKAKAAQVQRVLAQAQPLAGSAAETYLASRGLSNLPDCDALAYLPPIPNERGIWHSGLPSLLAIARNERGEPCAFQRIVLGDDGRKAQVSEGPVKTTIGKIGGNPIRFPARGPGRRLYICEGPETAATIWHASGCETWAVCSVSGFASAPVPADRSVILCPDRDAKGSPAHKTFQKAVGELRAKASGGLSIALAPEPEGSKADLNDTLQRAGMEAVREALANAVPVTGQGHKSAGLAPYFPSHDLDRITARDAHGEVVRGWFSQALPWARSQKADPLDDAPKVSGPAPRMMLTGAQGVGKTRAVVGGLTAAKGLVSVVFEPTLAKAEEFASDFEREAGEGSAPVPVVVRGRAAIDPENEAGQTMCTTPEAATALAKRGVSPRQSLCPSCPFRKECGHRRQEARIERLAADPQGVVLVAAHEYAFLPLPSEGVRPNLMIFDEAPRNLGVRSTVVTCDDLSVPVNYDGAGYAKSAVGKTAQAADAAADNLRLIQPLKIAIRDAFQDGAEGALQRLRDDGYTAGKVREALIALGQFAEREAGREAQRIHEEWKLADSFMEPFELEKRLASAMDRTSKRHNICDLRDLFAAVAVELDHGRPDPVAVLTGKSPDRRAIEVHSVEEMYHAKSVPFLHLDGTGRREMAEAIFGAMTHEHHPVERNADVTAITGKGFSIQSITGKMANGKALKGKSAEEAKALRRELIAFCDARPAALVIGNLRAIEALKEGGLRNETAHYGALRGLNIFERMGEVIVIGPQRPGPDAIEKAARAYAAAVGDDFVAMGAGAFPKETRGLRMRDGSAAPVEVECHPDPWGERILSQMRDSELEQAIDRVRPHFKSEPVKVWLLGNAVLDITVDRVMTWKDAKAGGSRIERAIAKHGVLPLTDREAARMFPEIWKAKTTARNDLKAIAEQVEATISQGKSLVVQNPNRILYLENGPLSVPVLVSYTIEPKQGGRLGSAHKALMWCPPDEARERLEQIAGPLRAFNKVEAWEAALTVADAQTEREAIQAAEAPPEPDPVEPQGVPGRTLHYLPIGQSVDPAGAEARLRAATGPTIGHGRTPPALGSPAASYGWFFV